MKRKIIIILAAILILLAGFNLGTMHAIKNANIVEYNDDYAIIDYGHSLHIYDNAPKGEK